MCCVSLFDLHKIKTFRNFENYFTTSFLFKKEYTNNGISSHKRIKGMRKRIFVFIAKPKDIANLGVYLFYYFGHIVANFFCQIVNDYQCWFNTLIDNQGLIDIET